MAIYLMYLFLVNTEDTYRRASIGPLMTVLTPNSLHATCISFASLFSSALNICHFNYALATYRWSSIIGRADPNNDGLRPDESVAKEQNSLSA